MAESHVKTENDDYYKDYDYDDDDYDWDEERSKRPRRQGRQSNIDRLISPYYKNWNHKIFTGKPTGRPMLPPKGTIPCEKYLFPPEWCL